jgi:hypothetical protein
MRLEAYRGARLEQICHNIKSNGIYTDLTEVKAKLRAVLQRDKQSGSVMAARISLSDE